MDELFAQIQKLIAEKLEIDADKITLDSSFRQDLGADSLDTYELVYAIEEEMGIKIPDGKVSEFETVRDAYDFIKSQSKESGKGCGSCFLLNMVWKNSGSKNCLLFKKKQDVNLKIFIYLIQHSIIVLFLTNIMILLSITNVLNF